MNKPEFTPGPWEADATHCRTAVNSKATANGPKKHIAMVNFTKNPKYEITEKEHRANAVLIASSPDLYDTLVKVERYLVTQGKETDELWCEVKAVIAKVRGE